MSKVKNISGGHLYVSPLGRGVDDGEVIEVPDWQDGADQNDPAMALIWNERQWQTVKDKAAKADGTDGKAAG